MKKLHLPFLFAALILTSCNVNNSPKKEEVKTPSNESVTLPEEIIEQPKEETPNDVTPKEEQQVDVTEIVEEEPPIIEVNNDEKEKILTSPVYRPYGTVDVGTLNLDVRSYEATITDSGRVHQKMDIVYLDYNYGGLEDLGYCWLEVIVTLTAREVHDGYQYLFLYNTSECQSSGESLLENFIPKFGDSIKQGMLFKEQFEIGPGYKKTSWEERSFRFYIHVGNMVDNLYLRYGANGILSDTWVNKDIKVSITPKITKN